LVQRGGDWAGCGPAQSLLSVPIVTAQPSTASVPTSKEENEMLNNIFKLYEYVAFKVV